MSQIIPEAAPQPVEQGASTAASRSFPVKVLVAGVAIINCLAIIWVFGPDREGAFWENLKCPEKLGPNIPEMILLAILGFVSFFLGLGVLGRWKSLIVSLIISTYLAIRFILPAFSFH